MMEHITIIQSVKPLLAVLVSIFAVPLIISARSENIREGWTFAAAIIKFLLIASMIPMVLSGTRLEFTIFEVLPNLPLKLRVDAFGLLFALVSSFLWIITSAYSIGYMRGLKEHSQTRYFSFFALALSATIGVAFSANLLTMYLFYEMLSLATYPLVTHHQDLKARSSGRKYLLYILGSSIAFLLPAIIVTYIVTGSINFTDQGVWTEHGSQTMIIVLLLMFLFGFAKSAIMPFHSWLPAAMVAPTPVSALLHAVAVVKVGAFCIVRTLTSIFGVHFLAVHNVSVLLSVIASVTIIVSSLIALSQDELKRRLAFSTIGQLSYIILGVALLSPSGILGSMLHIAMHAFGKITLFFCAGAIFVTTGKTKVSEMVGLGRKMPFTMGAFFIGSLSVIGIPPCGGFISKWYLVLGTLEAHQIGFLVVLLGSSLLNAAYFLPVVYRAFFNEAEGKDKDRTMKEAPSWTLFPLLTTAFISIVLFFYPQPFMKLAQLAVQTITGG